METPALSTEQREMLIHLIDRRMAKWPDAALVKLEVLTRMPETMSVPPVTARPVARAPYAPPPQPTQPTRIRFEKGLSRREAMMAGAGGVVTLLAAAGGAGWWQNRTRVQNMESSFRGLAGMCKKAVSQKDEANQRIQGFQDKVASTQRAISDFQKATDEADQWLQSVNENESLKKIDITSAASIFFTLGDKIIAIFTYLRKIPDLIDTSKKLLTILDNWFSDDNNIDNRLFGLLRSELFHSVDDINAQVNNLDQQV